jgi:hypothetical protein
MTVIAICIATPTSGAASIEGLPLTKAAPVHSALASVTGLSVLGNQETVRRSTPRAEANARADSCSARKAARYYRARYVYWLDKMGLEPSSGLKRRMAPASCPKYLAHVLQRKARAARAAFERWHRYHFAWREWMPAKHQRVARCETGRQGGTGPGGSRWDWDSGKYVSAYGIYRQGYDDDAHRVGNLGWDETLRKLGRYPTPREQMQAADSHRAAHGGWSGWGCRGA